jgi:CubicO group peptidase (beta-lactamase class C family)
VIESHRPRIFAVPLVALVLTTGACSSEPHEGAQEPGVPAVEEDALRDRLHGAVDDFLDSHTVPGASVALLQNGELIEVGSGMADIDSERPITSRTQFRVASVAKMYIATVVLKLVERGELSLDDPIARQATLPGPLAFAGDLTLRQLLSHTSGLGQTYVRDEDRGKPLTLIEQIERMPPPTCLPSECWSYADANYVLAEFVLEAATGQSIAELIRDELAMPFDLDDTEVLDPAVDDTPPQYALVYDDDTDKPLEPHRLFRQSLPLTPTFVTTAPDAARFADTLFSGGILNRSTLAEMLDTGAMDDLPCPEGCPFKYGLGLFHFDVAGHELVGHEGGSGALVVHDTQRDFTLAILTNGGDQDMRALLEAVLPTLEPPSAAPR